MSTNLQKIVLACSLAACTASPAPLPELGAYECRPMSAAAAAFQRKLPAGVEAASEPVAQACPDGYVPRYERAPRPARRPETSQAGPGKYYYAGLRKELIPATYAVAVGGRIRIADPAIVYDGDQVTSEIAVRNDELCTPDNAPPHNNRTLVETGYRKGYGGRPRLMISQWFSCAWWDDQFFEQVHSTYAPEMDLTSYVGTGINFSIQNFGGGDWVVFFNNALVGYFPKEPYFNMPSGKTVHYYGEVYATNDPPRTDMGNGQHASFATAAYIDNMSHSPAFGTVTPLANAAQSLTNASFYSLAYSNGTAMRHGGPGETCPAGWNLCNGFCVQGACP